jgi:NADH dehydrogenase
MVYPSILGSHPGADNACLASKGRAERILLEAKTPALVLRVPMVLGEGDFASRALAGRARAPIALLTRGGRSLEQPIYAGDVVEALVAGVTRPDLDDLALDLGGPEALPARELLRRAAALWGRTPRVLPVPRFLPFALAALLERLSKDPPVTRAMLGVLDHDDEVDPGEATRRLGIELTPLDETLRRCVGPEDG